MKRNVLDTQKYYISKELFIALESERLNSDSRKRKKLNKSPGLYLVCFRLLNQKNRELIYHYIYYDPIFVDVLLVYFYYKNVNSFRLYEWGDILTVIDKNVVDLSRFKSNEYDKHLLTNVEEFDHAFELINNSSYYINSIKTKCVNLINKMNYVTYNNKEILNLLNLMLDKDYETFINTILGNLVDSKVIKDLNKKDTEPLNLLNNSLFLVNNIKLLRSNLIDQGFKITEGPKPWRGQVNSMNSLLTILDMEFRNSLFNHNQYHVKCGDVDIKYALPKSKFTFRNIHMNLGNIRWYSTKTKVSKDLLSSKLLDRINKNSFRSDSEIYSQLTNFLMKSPINEKTQMKIEEFLLNSSYLDLQNKEDSLINYTLLGDTRIKEYIKEASGMLHDYLNNFRKKTINIKNPSQKTINRFYLQKILNQLNNNLIIEFCLGVLAKLISNTNRLSDECISRNICIDLGELLVKNYYYSIYLHYIKANIKVFHQEALEYSEKENDPTLKSELDLLYKNIHKKELYELKYMIKLLLDKYKILNSINTNIILNYTLSDWKSDNKDIVDIYENNSTLKCGLGSILVDWLNECKLVEENLVVIGMKEKNNYLVPYNKIAKIVANKDYSIRHLPLRIPMIVKPKLYTRSIKNGVVKEKLGGYLINDVRVTDPMIVPNWELQKSTLIKDPNVVYNLVNNVNSVAFKINKEVLDFIYTYADKYNLFLDDIRLQKEKVGKKLNKTEFKELESYISKLDLQENILGLAKVFSVVPEFYLPVRIDYRGRMICLSQYLNYQSNELAKSLLLFSKGEKMYKNDTLAINYFKAYGANCFGNKLDKKSWLDRCQWIDDNHEGIINYTTSDLIERADNKLLFTAFCIEYNKWYKSYNNIESSYFVTHLPIQLDATCNGYQHLSLLLYDYDMGEQLNLAKSSWEDKPKDFYSFIGMELIDYFIKKKQSDKITPEDKACYERLEKLVIIRSTIKKAIMTIPYNVSLSQMKNYLKEHFIDIEENKPFSLYDLRYKYKDDNNIILCHKDITFIATGLKEVLDLKFPRLKILVTYLKNIAKICNKLKLVIPWGTSSGLLVNQSYTSSTDIKLRPFTYSKTSFNLKLSTGKLSGSKQIRAFMPNLIHSLDAASLALLVDLYFKSSIEIRNFYAIHDCFAVTANNVNILINFLKQVYNKIYSEDEYLRKLNSEIIKHIKFSYGDDCFDDEKLEINAVIDGKEITLKYPNIDVVLGTELPNLNLIKESSYLIN